MAGDFFSRVANLIKGAANEFVKNLEEDNPEAVMASAQEAQEARVGHLASVVGQLERQLRQQQEALEKAKRLAQALGEEAASSVSDDEARALSLLEQKERESEKAKDLERQLEVTAHELEEAREGLKKARADAVAFKAEREQLLVARSTASLENAREGLEIGIPTNASDAALSKVRENFGKLESAAAEKAAAREQAKRRAQEELAALKKMSSSAASGGASGAASGAASNEGTGPLQEESRSVRTLDPAATEEAPSSPRDEEEPSPANRRTL